MLKFFNKYMKYLLVVFAALLMVVFLLPPGGLRPNRGQADFVEATFDGGKMTTGMRQQALLEMDLLQRVTSGLLPIPRDERKDPDTLAWVLAKYDAEQMGLWATDTEISTTLDTVLGTLGVEESFIAEFAVRENIPQQAIFDSIRSWLILTKYQEIMSGLGHLNEEQRRILLQERLLAAQQMQMASYFGNREMMLRAQHQLQVQTIQNRGWPRVSEPMLKQFVADMTAQVKIEGIRLDANRFTADLPTPSEAELNDLYTKYKSQFKGQSDPYGFGYKLEDRIKLEYITVPYERVLKTVSVDEEEVFSYYQDNKSLFIDFGDDPAEPEGDDTTERDSNDGADESDVTGDEGSEPAPTPEGGETTDEATDTDTDTGGCQDEPETADADATDDAGASDDGATATDDTTTDDADDETPEPVFKSYAEVRDQIENDLRAAKARDLAESIMRFVIGQLQQDRRDKKVGRDATGMWDVSKFEPVSLGDIAERVVNNEQFNGIRPDVVRIDNRWLTREQAADKEITEGLAGAVYRLENGGEIAFVPYAFGAYSFIKDDDDDQRRALRLQKKIPSDVLVNPVSSDVFVFRLIETEGQRDPKSLDEVREQVIDDAKRLTAYEKLVAEKETWRKKAVDKSLIVFSEDGKYEYHRPPSTTRRLQFGGGYFVPTIEGFGTDEQFVDALFDFAATLRDRHDKINTIPDDELITAIPLPKQQSLAIVQIDSYRPATQSAYDLRAKIPATATAASLFLSSELADPLNAEVLKERLNFKWKQQPEDDEEPAEDAKGDGTSDGAKDGEESA